MGRSPDQSVETISYQVFNQNAYSLGICTAGNFMGGLVPTPEQVEAVGHLIASLSQKFDIRWRM